MEKKETVENIISLIRNTISSLDDDIEIEGDTPLIASGLIESFDLINIISEIEKNFNIKLEIDTLDIAQFETANEIINMLQSLRS